MRRKACQELRSLLCVESNLFEFKNDCFGFKAGGDIELKARRLANGRGYGSGSDSS